VTEEEWLVSDDPGRLLGFLGRKRSVRKLRLFGCACCRRMWHLLHKRARKAVAVLEDFLDGRADAPTLEKAQAGLRDNTYWDVIPRGLGEAEQEVARLAVAAVAEALMPANRTLDTCWQTAATLTMPTKQDGHGVETAFSAWGDVAGLLRDIFGNPFRPARIEASWLTATVVVLAQTIYDGRCFDDLPVLADALEDAGCTDRALLDHLHGPGPHVRGCWPVDLLLARE
jgi:hypothetical protein